jgi:hypothetical protein
MKQKKSLRTNLWMYGICFVILFTACNKKTVTFDSLLQEMTDRKLFTYLPENDYKIIMFSSMDPKSKNIKPGEDGWWANDDCSHFLREENNNGRREFVLLDAPGPGAIIRWWMTFNKGTTDGTLRIYIDGEEEPVIEGNVLDILSGNAVAQWPLAASVSPETTLEDRGHNFYVPIPFEKHCKITFESDVIQLQKNGLLRPNVWYNIEYRAYQKGTKVESLTQQILSKNSDNLAATSKKLLEIYPKTSEYKKVNKRQLAPGEFVDLHFEEVGKALNWISAKIESENPHQALRSTVLSISFDGQQTVWVPVGDFFGTGYQIKPSMTIFSSVTKDGDMEAYWLMPFQETAIITISNFGNENITVDLSASTDDYKWNSKSMYFGASWREHYLINTATDTTLQNHDWHFDVNFVDLQGQGLYMGDGITLFNTSNKERPSSNWWGEGDEKIFVDGEDFPSIFGTGTEDYYGYAKCRPQSFTHPFIAQPSGEGNYSPGMTINFRYRALDAIPFNNEISVNIEIWHWSKTIINYAMYSFWYARPGFTSNVEPDIQSVKNPVILDRVEIYSE